MGLKTAEPKDADTSDINIDRKLIFGMSAGMYRY